MLSSLALTLLLPALQAAASQQPAPPPQATEAEKPWPPIGVSRPGKGVTPPRLVREVKPNYRADAMREKIQGSVWLEAVVETDGTVGEVRVRRSLDSKFGMDEEAVSCLKKWTFAPGKKDGVAVPVIVEVEMSFTLGK